MLVKKINEYITLRLEEDYRTTIFVNEDPFEQCMYLLINIPVDRVREFDTINSIDEAAQYLGRDMEGGEERWEFDIPPETEFWGHCSNIQAWVEHNYDTRLLHSNLAFPLLRELSEVGDPIAKKVFKEEIAKRLDCGFESVVYYLLECGYLDFLDEEEIKALSEKTLNLILEFHGVESIDEIFDWRAEKTKRIRDMERRPVIPPQIVQRPPPPPPPRIRQPVNRSTYRVIDYNYAHLIRMREVLRNENDGDIEILKLRHNNISLIEDLDRLPNLQVLDLSFNQITEINGLENLRNLKELILSHNRITEIKGLDKLQRLEVLELHDNRITEIKGLENLVNLKRLTLYNNHIPREVLHKVGRIAYVDNVEEFIDYCRNLSLKQPFDDPIENLANSSVHDEHFLFKTRIKRYIHSYGMRVSANFLKSRLNTIFTEILDGAIERAMKNGRELF